MPRYREFSSWLFKVKIKSERRSHLRCPDVSNDLQVKIRAVKTLLFFYISDLSQPDFIFGCLDISNCFDNTSLPS